MTADSRATTVSAYLPEFPWDRLDECRHVGAATTGGLVDLSVGTPVDATPAVAQTALCGAADSPGYPTTYGTEALRAAAVAWLVRRHGVTGLAPAAVLPVIGAKELVAWLPTLLGARGGDIVVHPEVAYPTYDVGARLAGATPVASNGLLGLGPARVAVVWVNSPANPTGEVLPAAHLRKMVDWARERGAVLVSDECYLEFGWEEQPVSVLHPDVCGSSHANVLALHSMSKRSNLAGYRAGFVAGDPALVAELLAVRKHAGMMVPAPVQAAMTAALGDDEHVDAQRERYAGRRAVLRPALESAGFRVDGSQAGLYLWATRHEPCWDSVRWLAQRGILVAPGEFYGPGGARHVRVALTATDERIATAVRRLAA